MGQWPESKETSAWRWEVGKSSSQLKDQNTLSTLVILGFSYSLVQLISFHSYSTISILESQLLIQTSPSPCSSACCLCFVYKVTATRHTQLFLLLTLGSVHSVRWHSTDSFNICILTVVCVVQELETNLKWHTMATGLPSFVVHLHHPPHCVAHYLWMGNCCCCFPVYYPVPCLCVDWMAEWEVAAKAVVVLQVAWCLGVRSMNMYLESAQSCEQWS